MEDLLLSLLKYIVYIIIIYTALTYLFKTYSDFGMINSRWYQGFDFQFSTQEFYAAVEAIVKNKKIPETTITRKTYAQGGIYTAKREYLRIAHQDYMVLICAAPFGFDGFFVSYRTGEWMNIFKDLIPRIPLFGGWLSRLLFSKTYFQIDTADMFHSTVRNAVMEAINNLTSEKGYRPLTEAERMPEYIAQPYRNKQ